MATTEPLLDKNLKIEEQEEDKSNKSQVEDQGTVSDHFVKQEEQQQVETNEMQDNPKLAIILFLAAGFTFCMNFTCAKILYESKPDISPMQVLAYRSTISMVLLSLLINRNLFKVMFKSVDRSSAKGLIIRTLQGNFTIYVNFAAVKYFNLTIMQMVVNCAPLLTVVMAGPILGEKVSAIQYVYMLLAFGSVAIMIFGAPEPEEDTVEEKAGIMAYIMLILNPIAVAIGTLAMRQMRKLNDSVVSCWMSLSAMFVFYPIVAILGQSAMVFTEFNWADWLCIIGCSVFSTLSQTLRFMALRKWKASSLQPYTFTQPLQQFLVETLFFHANFTGMQIAGVSLLVALYAMQPLILCIHRRLKEKQ